MNRLHIICFINPSWFKQIVEFLYENQSFNILLPIVALDEYPNGFNKNPFEVDKDAPRNIFETILYGLALAGADVDYGKDQYLMMIEHYRQFETLTEDIELPPTTQPEKIRFVITDGDYTKYVVEYGPTYVIDDDPTRQYFETQANGEIIYLPKSTQWVELISKVTDENNPMCCGSEAYYRQRKNSIVKDPRLITRWLNSKLQKSEAESVKVKSAGCNQWWVGGNSRALFLHEALTKVACQYGINAKDAGGILVDAQENGVSNIWILDKRAQMKIASELYKMAQPPMPQETTQEQQVPAQNGQFDPSQGGQMDPYAQQMQGPPPISPTDLAIGEAVQRLTQQSEMQAQQIQAQMEQSQQAMEMQQQNTQQLVSVLQGIQQRSTEISQASQGGASIPQGAMQSPLAAAEMDAPPEPEEEPPPPMPVMEGDAPDPNTLDQEINPEDRKSVV
jgi:hypothetical protein